MITLEQQHQLFRRLSSYHAFFCASSTSFPRSIASFERISEIKDLILQGAVDFKAVTKMIEDYEREFNPSN